MSSSKNLKVYRIQFITDIKQMAFKVKFPCQMKMVWKRSNETAQTSLVQVKDGTVKFNQTLKLYVNMYFDVTTNRFVEKKCIYSFLIITEKGQKSAGSVTFDLSQFFNKRIYQIEDEFTLQKCPLADTKVKMKIFYEESTEQGYDSMSRISAASQQMDMSSMSVDIAELEKSALSNNESEKSQKKQQQTLKQSNYDLLNESDIGSSQTFDQSSQQGSTDIKTESSNSQIAAMTMLTGKMNDFVYKCASNIKNQVQSLKLKIKQKEEEIVNEKILKEKYEKESQNLSKKVLEGEKQFQNYRQEQQVKLANEMKKVEQFQGKLAKSEKLCSQLELNMSEKGENQAQYIAQLKANFGEEEKKLKQAINAHQQETLEEKKLKNQLTQKNKLLQKQLMQMNERLNNQTEKNRILEGKEKQRERQLEEIRMKMEDAYENMVNSFGSMLK